jgi:hypothetical protein
MELSILKHDRQELINSGVKSEDVYHALTVIELRRINNGIAYIERMTDHMQHELGQININIQYLQT